MSEVSDAPDRAGGAGGVRVRDALAGQHVLLTGVTGFLGEALLQRLLRDVPEVRTSVLVRPRGSTTAASRVATLLGKAIFADTVEAAGGVEALMAARIAVVEGDLTDPPALPTDLDAVVHCAGDVSFDPPVDEGFRANVVGVRELLERIEEASGHGERDVHYLHVSTAYVAGRRRGAVFEEPLDHAVDVDAEVAWGLARRPEVEARSRSVDVLTELGKDAGRDRRRAGPLTTAAAVEEARRTWVKDQLVALGAERARSLGWTDCYTFTKALGERVVEAHATRDPRGRRVTVHRPTIVESALEQPYPGWIEGFKMAEPLILAYGRGELPMFPGGSDTIVDVVPVDHVVASIIACLARPPEPAAPAYVHLSSGHRNPLTFGAVYENVRAYFQAHPFAATPQGHVPLPVWSWSGTASVQRAMSTGERLHRTAERLLSLAPRTDRTTGWIRSLETQGRRLAFLRRYLDVYQEYAQADLRFVDDAAVALRDGLHPDDREVFAFDTAVIDWAHYLQEVHCPSVTQPVRELDVVRAKRKKVDPAALRTLEPRADGAGGQVAAFFDMDGTLLSSNVVESFLWLRLADLPASRRVGETARLARRLPRIVQADRHDRAAMLREVYREYAGARLEDLEAIVDEHLTAHVLERLAPAAVRRVREHRAAGHTTILITGALRPLTRPVAPLFDHVHAADLAVDDRGRCTGQLAASTVVGESRGALVRELGRSLGLDLAASYAYADSYSDLPLLEAVGRPVAVRPDVPLYQHARTKRWNIVDWTSPETSTRSLDPAGRR
ncbi:HAD-IB family hydrolase [Nocardioides litoris]|uniref:HAD-IB family hydrolase n=1 Tax=Nocardioides litoris TaxID=1926648 RepID=UPI001124674D|nr:HAD-IB family hydrolase [Nocardioides litoris]